MLTALRKSDADLSVFGEAGRHSGTATGAPQLPLNASVQLEMILRLKIA